MIELSFKFQIGNSDNGVGETGKRARRRSPSRASLHPVLLYREALGRAALRESALAHAYQAYPGGLWLRGRNDPVQDRRGRHSPSEKEINSEFKLGYTTILLLTKSVTPETSH